MARSLAVLVKNAVDAVVFPHQGVIFRVPLIGVGVVADNEPVQRGRHGGLELQLTAQV